MTGTFLDEIAIGRHVSGESPLHKAAAWSKAICFTTAAVCCFLYQSAAAFLILGTVVASLSLASALPQRLFWRSLRPINLLALFTVLAWAFINHGDAPNFSWYGLHIGGLYAARLVLITLLTTLFFLTTRPDVVIAFGIRCLAPLRLLGIDRHELSLLVHLAYRFIPLLRREIEEMKLGRAARNLPSPKGFAKLKAGFDALVYIFVGALKRAETMSFALEERGVVDSWQHRDTDDSPTGLGGWMNLLILLSSIALIWADGQML